MFFFPDDTDIISDTDLNHYDPLPDAKVCPKQIGLTMTAKECG